MLAYNNRGFAKYQKGDLNGALADYTRAIELNPKNALAYNNCGGAIVTKGDYDGAIADCNRAIELDPKFASAYNNRGNGKYAKGEVDGALADYTRTIELDPKDTNAYFSRGRCRAEMRVHSFGSGEQILLTTSCAAIAYIIFLNCVFYLGYEVDSIAPNYL